MRILAIAPTGFFADYGCHIRIMGQLQALQRLGHDVHLVTYPAGRNIPGLVTRRLPIPGVHSMPVGSSRRKLLFDLGLTPVAFAEAVRFRPQIIHAYLHEGALIGSLLAPLVGAALTFDYQGSLSAEMLDHGFIAADSRWLAPLARLERWIETRPGAIFPSSLHAADLLARRGIARQRIYHLPDSVDPDLFHPQAADLGLLADLGLNSARPTVVYLGLLATYQGIDLLLRAIAQLGQHPAQFLIMGFPNIERYRALAVSLGVAESVRFTGAIPYEQAPRYLALGQIAVAPKLSATEGSGKLLPYMSMALPVVATDTAVHRQYLGNDGVFVRATPQDLADGIATALADLAALRAGAARLRQRVCAQFTWLAGAQQMESVFGALCYLQPQVRPT